MMDNNKERYRSAWCSYTIFGLDYYSWRILDVYSLIFRYDYVFEMVWVLVLNLYRSCIGDLFVYKTRVQR